MLLGNASVSGQTGFKVSLDDHIAYYLLGLDFICYQQNLTLVIVFWVSDLPSPASADQLGDDHFSRKS